MALDRVGALREERAVMLALCRDLDAAEWQMPSKADGWRVQDVIAHLGSSFHAFFTPAWLRMARSDAIERTNDEFVDRRRDWAPARTLAEYERWSRRAIALAAVIARSPVAGLPLRLGELGTFPAERYSGAAVFDHHTHLRHDIAAALDRPVPGTDANRLAVVLEWMFGVLGNQLRADQPAWLRHPVAIRLQGPGGGTWLVRPDGSVTQQPGDAAARITGSTLEFPEWGTGRADWRDRDVTVGGDSQYGARFLDAINVV